MLCKPYLVLIKYKWKVITNLKLLWGMIAHYAGEENHVPKVMSTNQIHFTK